MLPLYTQIAMVCARDLLPPWLQNLPAVVSAVGVDSVLDPGIQAVEASPSDDITVAHCEEKVSGSGCCAELC